MLRLRRGAGQLVKHPQCCRLPRSSFLRDRGLYRTFATDVQPENKNEASNLPTKVPDLTEKVMSSVKRAKRLRRQFKELKKSSSPQPTERKPPTKSKKRRGKPLAPIVPNNFEEGTFFQADGFDETLNVVRKVYGVEDPAKGGKSQAPVDEVVNQIEREESGEAQQAPPSVPEGTMGWEAAMGAWGSMSEILERGPKHYYSQETPVFYEDLPRPHHVEPSGEVDLEKKAKARTTRKARRAEQAEVAELEAKLEAKKNAAVAAKLSKVKAGKKTKKKARASAVEKISPSKLKFEPVDGGEELEVPRLSHNLDRVLFNPGVYDLQDARSGVYNFDPYLSTIMPVNEFDFDALAQYITSSKDNKLTALCSKYNKKYCGSTSSMTAMLSHFHFLLSAWREPDFGNISRNFFVESRSFTKFTRAPAAAFATLKDGVYAIDADKSFDTTHVLSMLGKSMEKLLTLPKDDFEKYRKTRSHQLSEEERNAEDGFHYTALGDFLMRSQLDAHDPRLPGSGMFDLKTRAVLPIRMDVGDYKKGRGYEIRNRLGQWESYEREYYDMIRAAFLKYSLQVRMGRMDGIFVAFHNTMRIFGFQYISLEEMDQALHGTDNRAVGDAEFRTSVHLLNQLLNRGAKRFPGKSLRLHVETRETAVPVTYFFVEPVEYEDVVRIQEGQKASVGKIQRDILGLARMESETEVTRVREEIAELERPTPEEASVEEPSQEKHGQQAWDDLLSKVDETVEDDSRGLQAVRDAIKEALEQSGLLKAQSKEEQEDYLNRLFQAVADGNSGLKASKETRETEEREETEETEEADEELEEAEQNGFEVTTREARQTTESNDDTTQPVIEDIESTATQEVRQTTESNDGTTQPVIEDIESTMAQEIRQNTESKDGTTQSVVEDVESSNAAVSEHFDEGTAQIMSPNEGVSEPVGRLSEDGSTLTSEDPSNEVNSPDSSISEPSLKDHFVEVARRVQHKWTRSAGETSSQSVEKTSANLAMFEKVLTDLVAESNKAAADQEEEGEGEGEGEQGEAASSSKQTPGEKSKDSVESTRERPATHKVRRTYRYSDDPKQLLGMVVTIQNKIGDQVLPRINVPSDGALPRYHVEYVIEELTNDQARAIYAQVKKRRANIHVTNPADKARSWNNAWGGKLPLKVSASERWRGKKTREEANKPISVAWANEPLPPTARFYVEPQPAKE